MEQMSKHLQLPADMPYFLSGPGLIITLDANGISREM
jgi:hypothetical protein